jgi:hypothetical protein
MFGKKAEAKQKAEVAKLQKEEAELIDNWNISLMLDTYDDIFSDFDPRHFSERAISHDFLQECRRASIEKVSKGLEIRLMMPEKLRDPISEGIIHERLHKHFQKHYRDKLEQKRRIKREGAIWTGAGMVSMVFAGVLTAAGGFWNNILLVLFEPAGWFLVWTGFEMLLKDVRSKVPDLEFYSKMASADFKFLSY